MFLAILISYIDYLGLLSYIRFRMLTRPRSYMLLLNQVNLVLCCLANPGLILGLTPFYICIVFMFVVHLITVIVTVSVAVLSLAFSHIQEFS